jgi:phospholipid-transporting ATPase
VLFCNCKALITERHKSSAATILNATLYDVTRRFLKDLLLVHGRWNYRRMSVVVLYSFYKNMVLVVTLFLFNISCGFSGTPVYEVITDF